MPRTFWYALICYGIGFILSVVVLVYMIVIGDTAGTWLTVGVMLMVVARIGSLLLYVRGRSTSDKKPEG